MNEIKLGKLKRLNNLREVWHHEAMDFTKWLSRESNISLLGEELGINIRVLQTEAGTGRYSVDILAKDEEDEKTIIIENQLEMTDHDHLGKIIVYASGHDADIQIWIVKDVRDEHKQAVDWLNEHSDEHVNIFLVQLELWQINDSEIAPKFQIISKPNNWTKAIRKGGNTKLGNAETMQLNFWEDFSVYCKNNNYNFSLSKPKPLNWNNVMLGTSSFHIALVYNTKKRYVSCELYFNNDKEKYYEIEKDKEKINKLISNNLEWQPLKNKKASRIRLTNRKIIIDPSGKNWNDAFEWLKNTIELFKKVFSDYIN